MQQMYIGHLAGANLQPPSLVRLLNLDFKKADKQFNNRIWIYLLN